MHNGSSGGASGDAVVSIGPRPITVLVVDDVYLIRKQVAQLVGADGKLGGSPT